MFFIYNNIKLLLCWHQWFCKISSFYKKFKDHWISVPPYILPASRGLLRDGETSNFKLREGCRGVYVGTELQWFQDVKEGGKTNIDLVVWEEEDLGHIGISRTSTFRQEIINFMNLGMFWNQRQCGESEMCFDLLGHLVHYEASMVLSSFGSSFYLRNNDTALFSTSFPVWTYELSQNESDIFHRFYNKQPDPNNVYIVYSKWGGYPTIYQTNKNISSNAKELLSGSGCTRYHLPKRYTDKCNGNRFIFCQVMATRVTRVLHPGAGVSVFPSSEAAPGPGLWSVGGHPPARQQPN